MTLSSKQQQQQLMLDNILIVKSHLQSPRQISWLRMRMLGIHPPIMNEPSTTTISTFNTSSTHNTETDDTSTTNNTLSLQDLHTESWLQSLQYLIDKARNYIGVDDDDNDDDKKELFSKKERFFIIDSYQDGLPFLLIEILQFVYNSWMVSIQQQQTSFCDVTTTKTVAYTDTTITHMGTNLVVEMEILIQLLNLFQCITSIDHVLHEELLQCGLNTILYKIIQMDYSSCCLSQHHHNQEYKNTTTTTPTTAVDNDGTFQNHNVYIDEDTFADLYDLASGMIRRFHSLQSPFTRMELIHRLPLVFTVYSPTASVPMTTGRNQNCLDKVTIWIQQVTERQSDQDDVGFVMWPSAVVLSSWLLYNASILQDKQYILELGAGCGLSGLVVSKISSILKFSNNNNNKVIVSDFNPTVLSNLQRNIDLNDLSKICFTSHLDFYDYKGTNTKGSFRVINKEFKKSQQQSNHEALLGEEDDNIQSEKEEDTIILPGLDLIIAADIICKASDSVAVSKTLYDILRPGGEAILVSGGEDHRFGVEIFESECQKVGLHVTVINVKDLYDGQLLPSDGDDDPCGLRNTSGYVEGMSLIMFKVVKV